MNHVSKGHYFHLVVVQCQHDTFIIGIGHHTLTIVLEYAAQKTLGTATALHFFALKSRWGIERS